MDISDLIGNDIEFPILKKWTYLNHAGISPLPARVASAMREYIAQAESAAHLGADWWGEIDRIRASAAALINAEPDEIAFIKNTSEGVSTLAGGMTFEPGDRIVSAAMEYPANVYPWMETARRTGAELLLLPSDTTPDGHPIVSMAKLLAAADHPRTKLLSISHVQYTTGQRMDLAAIGAFCRQRNIVFHVDAIQSLGALPMDVKSMQIDCLSSGSHKWLLAAQGSGIFFIRRELQDRVRPVLLGAISVVDWQNFGQLDFTLRPDSGRYESGSSNLVGIFALGAAIGLLTDVTIDAISARIEQVTNRLIEGLTTKKYEIASPRSHGQWSGIVSFTAPNLNLARVCAALHKDHSIEILVREGRLRSSPHFYNTDAQIDALIDALPPL